MSDIPSAVLKIHGVAKLLIDSNKVQCDIVSSVPQCACIYQCKASDSCLGLPLMTPNGHLPNGGLAKALAIWAERTIKRKEAAMMDQGMKIAATIWESTVGNHKYHQVFRSTVQITKTQLRISR
jgi:hypothetical protein